MEAPWNAAWKLWKPSKPELEAGQMKKGEGGENGAPRRQLRVPHTNASHIMIFV
jgi:hypothetical protein